MSIDTTEAGEQVRKGTGTEPEMRPCDEEHGERETDVANNNPYEVGKQVAEPRPQRTAAKKSGIVVSLGPNFSATTTTIQTPGRSQHGQPPRAGRHVTPKHSVFYTSISRKAPSARGSLGTLASPLRGTSPRSARTAPTNRRPELASIVAASKVIRSRARQGQSFGSALHAAWRPDSASDDDSPLGNPEQQNSGHDGGDYSKGADGRIGVVKDLFGGSEAQGSAVGRSWDNVKPRYLSGWQRPSRYRFRRYKPKHITGAVDDGDGLGGDATEFEEEVDVGLLLVCQHALGLGSPRCSGDKKRLVDAAQSPKQSKGSPGVSKKSFGKNGEQVNWGSPNRGRDKDADAADDDAMDESFVAPTQSKELPLSTTDDYSVVRSAQKLLAERDVEECIILTTASKAPSGQAAPSRNDGPRLSRRERTQVSKVLSELRGRDYATSRLITQDGKHSETAQKNSDITREDLECAVNIVKNYPNAAAEDILQMIASELKTKERLNRRQFIVHRSQRAAFEKRELLVREKLCGSQLKELEHLGQLAVEDVEESTARCERRLDDARAFSNQLLTELGEVREKLVSERASELSVLTRDERKEKIAALAIVRQRLETIRGERKVVRDEEHAARRVISKEYDELRRKLMAECKGIVDELMHVEAAKRKKEREEIEAEKARKRALREFRLSQAQEREDVGRDFETDRRVISADERLAFDAIRKASSEESSAIRLVVTAREENERKRRQIAESDARPPKLTVKGDTSKFLGYTMNIDGDPLFIFRSNGLSLRLDRESQRTLTPEHVSKKLRIRGGTITVDRRDSMHMVGDSVALRAELDDAVAETPVAGFLSNRKNSSNISSGLSLGISMRRRSSGGVLISLDDNADSMSSDDDGALVDVDANGVVSVNGEPVATVALGESMLGRKRSLASTVVNMLGLTFHEDVTMENVELLLHRIAYSNGVQRGVDSSAEPEHVVMLDTVIALQFVKSALTDDDALQTITKTITTKVRIRHPLITDIKRPAVDYPEGSGETAVFKDVTLVLDDVKIVNAFSAPREVERSLVSTQGYKFTVAVTGWTNEDCILFPRQSPFAFVRQDDNGGFVLHKSNPVGVFTGRVNAGPSFIPLPSDDPHYIVVNFNSDQHCTAMVLLDFIRYMTYINVSLDPPPGPRTIDVRLESPKDRHGGIRSVLNVTPIDDPTEVELNNEHLLFRIAPETPERLLQYLPPRQPLYFAPEAIVTDPDSDRFDGGYIEVHLTTGVELGDMLYVVESDTMFVDIDGYVIFEEDRVAKLTEGIFLRSYPEPTEKIEAGVRVEIIDCTLDFLQFFIRNIVFAAAHESPQSGARLAEFNMIAGDPYVVKLRKFDPFVPVHHKSKITVAPPLFTLKDFSYLYREGAGAVLLAAHASIRDEPNNKRYFLGGAIEAKVVVGQNHEDRLYFRNVDHSQAGGLVFLDAKEDDFAPRPSALKKKASSSVLKADVSMSSSGNPPSQLHTPQPQQLLSLSHGSRPASGKPHLSVDTDNTSPTRTPPRTPREGNLTARGGSAKPISPHTRAIQMQSKRFAPPLHREFDVSQGSLQNANYLGRVANFSEPRAILKLRNTLDATHPNQRIARMTENAQAKRHKSFSQGAQVTMEESTRNVKRESRPSIFGRRKSTARLLEGTGGLMNMCPLRRKDIQSVLRLLTYELKSANPQVLKKIILITVSDGGRHTTQNVIEVEIEAVDDATEIIRDGTGTVDYRQGSRETYMCPFEDCSLFDPDTESFNGGYLRTAISAGALEGDTLSFLTYDQQRQILRERAEDITDRYFSYTKLPVSGKAGKNLTATPHHRRKFYSGFLFEFNKTESLVYVHLDGRMRPIASFEYKAYTALSRAAKKSNGKGGDKAVSLRVEFFKKDGDRDDVPDIPLLMVEGVMQCFTFFSAQVPPQLRAGLRHISVVVSAGGEDIQGDLIVKVSLLQPLVHSNGVAPHGIFRKMLPHINVSAKLVVPMDHQFRNGYAAVHIVSGFVFTEDELVFTDVGKGRQFEMKNGGRTLYSIKGEYLGSVHKILEQQTTCGFVITFDSASSMNGATLAQLLRSLAYVNTARVPRAQVRWIQFTVSDGGYFSVSQCEAEIEVEKVASSTEIDIGSEPVVFLYGGSSVPVFPAAFVSDPDIYNFGPPAYVDIEGSKGDVLTLSDEYGISVDDDAVLQYGTRIGNMATAAPLSLTGTIRRGSHAAATTPLAPHPPTPPVETVECLTLVNAASGTNADSLSLEDSSPKYSPCAEDLDSSHPSNPTGRRGSAVRARPRRGSVRRGSLSAVSPSEAMLATEWGIGKNRLRVELQDCPVAAVQDLLRSVHYARNDSERYMRRALKLSFRRNDDPQVAKMIVNVESTPPQFSFSDGPGVPLQLSSSFELFPTIFVIGTPWRVHVKRIPDGNDGLKITLGPRTGLTRRGADVLSERNKIASVLTSKDAIGVIEVQFVPGTTTSTCQKLLRCLMIPICSNIRKHVVELTFAASPHASYSRTLDIYYTATAK